MGHLHFANEIMVLKPSFALKQNLQGLAPLHVALQHGHEKMVHRLVDLNNELVRVQGREGFTPLHLASQIGNVELLNKFLDVCPDSIKDVTIRSETALHIAARKGQDPALKALVGWLSSIGDLQLKRTILNSKDDQDHTILNIAVLENSKEAVELLIESCMMNLEAKNLEGNINTALAITSSDDIRRTLEKAAIKANKFSWKRWLINIRSRLRKHMSGEALNAYLVVLALIAAATYQATLSPPGGLSQTDGGTNNTLSRVAFHSLINSRKTTAGNEGNSILPTFDFLLFFMPSMSCFMASTMLILAILPKKASWILLYTPMLLFQISYVAALLVISPTPTTTTTIILLLYAFWSIPGFLILKFST
ncbi:ankyrin repeat-containing protein BDA1 [Cajanus cajan]|uniref:Ankyrin repeat-containing protein At3g12360 family n=1 Tax=Cajanus cajan TaxID=3821 RepID=A0A151RJ95_CAJCA|nr:ankyrin repeat-containing protein BDA1 [Cajanus cajan]KYP42608.1 Ankyrin repeat-containing protein At3g12360 family [Cajanus cajan]